MQAEGKNIQSRHLNHLNHWVDSITAAHSEEPKQWEVAGEAVIILVSSRNYAFLKDWTNNCFLREKKDFFFSSMLVKMF